MTAQELEQQLSHALALFKFILAKDVFEAFYKKDLAKRLLLGKSASQDAELFMIRRLEEECGSTFTSKLQSMIDDMETSRRVLAEFKVRRAAPQRPRSTVRAHRCAS
jgi:cullin-4